MTSPPAGEYLIALSIRFPMMMSSRIESASTGSLRRTRSSKRSRCLDVAAASAVFRPRRTTSRRSRLLRPSCKRSSSSRAASTISLASMWICAAFALKSGSTGLIRFGIGPSDSSSIRDRYPPSIAAGPRNSCDASRQNSDFAFSSSASWLAFCRNRSASTCCRCLA